MGGSKSRGNHGTTRQEQAAQQQLCKRRHKQGRIKADTFWRYILFVDLFLRT